MKSEIYIYSIQEINSMMKEKLLLIQPAYQRKNVWDLSRKRKLIDSVLREWIIPPITIIESYSRPKSLEVLDGQQRLNAFHEYLEDKFSYENLFFSDLSLYKRKKILHYQLNFMKIENIDYNDIGEYFYRLNDQLKLTDIEKRNALNSKFRNNIQRITEKSIESGFNNQYLGFSNLRFSYDDIVAKIIVYLDYLSLNINIEKTLDDYYSEYSTPKQETYYLVETTMGIFTNFLTHCKKKVEFKKSNVISWLFLIGWNHFYNLISEKDLFLTFEEFEINRYQFSNSYYPILTKRINATYYMELIRIFNDYMSKSPSSKLSLLVRNMVLKIILFNQFRDDFIYSNSLRDKENQYILERFTDYHYYERLEELENEIVYFVKTNLGEY